MLKPQLAIADFKIILTIEPNNMTVKQQFEATQKLVRRIEFEKVGQLAIWQLGDLLIALRRLNAKRR